MPKHLTFHTSLLFVVAVTAIMIAVILWWFPHVVDSQRTPKKLLASAFLVLFLWHAFQFASFSSQESFLYVSSTLLVLLSMALFMPLNYLYFHSLAYPSFSKSALIHLILPIIIVIINLYHFSGSGDFPIDLSLLLIHFQIGIYWVMEVNLVMKLLSISKKGLIHINVHWLRWTISYLVIQVLLFFPYFLWNIGNISFPAILHPEIIEAFCCLLLSLSLFFQPFLLFGIRDIKSKDFSEKLHLNFVAKNLPKSENSPPPETQKIERYVSKHHPYLDKDITITKLAIEVGISPESLNDYLASKKLSFEEYLNLKRIIYSQNIIKEKAYHDMTLDMLAKQSGFMDRKSFISSFKKHTGYNPSDYIKHFF